MQNRVHFPAAAARTTDPYPELHANVILGVLPGNVSRKFGIPSRSFVGLWKKVYFLGVGVNVRGVRFSRVP